MTRIEISRMQDSVSIRVIACDTPRPIDIRRICRQVLNIEDQGLTITPHDVSNPLVGVHNVEERKVNG